MATEQEIRDKLLANLQASSRVFRRRMDDEHDKFVNEFRVRAADRAPPERLDVAVQALQDIHERVVIAKLAKMSTFIDELMRRYDDNIYSSRQDKQEFADMLSDKQVEKIALELLDIQIENSDVLDAI